jgi:hypothetical protein
MMPLESLRANLDNLQTGLSQVIEAIIACLFEDESPSTQTSPSRLPGTGSSPDGSVCGVYFCSTDD